MEVQQAGVEVQQEEGNHAEAEVSAEHMHRVPPADKAREEAREKADKLQAHRDAQAAKPLPRASNRNHTQWDVDCESRR